MSLCGAKMPITIGMYRYKNCMYIEWLLVLNKYYFEAIIVTCFILQGHKLYLGSEARMVNLLGL